MSLSDYIKYMRATRGGATPWEIAEATGVPVSQVHLIEVKHRRVGEDDAVLEKLATYFEVPVEELTSRRDQYRKLLAEFLGESRQNSAKIALRLENGEELTGTVAWYSREAVALSPSSDTTNGADIQDPVVVQRGWIASWRALPDMKENTSGD